MPDKPNFVLVPDPEPEPLVVPARRSMPAAARAPALPTFGSALTALRNALFAKLESPPPAQTEAPPLRPRLVFGFDATASREPAWATARQVTDALVRALPGALDVALAVHGGSRLHTFTEFTANPATLRDRAAAIRCRAGSTQMLPILSRALGAAGVRVVTYIGDVFEE